MGGVPDDLRKIFVRLGKEKGLDDSLLNEVLDHLVKSQYVSKGDRIHVANQLRRILEKYEG
tara:strand:+ start:2651 stop:2833 length:183 start_codon:yes stop_codon:yes gene_type:complete